MKLLVVKLHALGDFVIATSGMKRIREGLPEADIHVLTAQWCAAAAQGLDLYYKIRIVPDEIFFKPGFSTVVPTLKLVREIHSQNYDAAILFHASKKVVTFFKACGIKYIFHFTSINRGDDEAGLLNNSLYLDEQRHSAMTAWELGDLAVRRLGGREIETPKLDDLSYEWYLDESELGQVDKQLEEHNIQPGKFFLVLPGGGVNPNSTGTDRRWDRDKFVELIDTLASKYKLPMVLSGGPSDVPVAGYICEKCDANVVNFTGKHSIRLSGALLHRAKMVIVNDTGPLHIASAVGAPLVAIFGPTGPNLKRPPGKKSRVAWLGLPCSPCYFGTFEKCIFDDIRCMVNLGVDVVLNEIDQLIRDLDRAEVN